MLSIRFNDSPHSSQLVSSSSSASTYNIGGENILKTNWSTGAGARRCGSLYHAFLARTLSQSLLGIAARGPIADVPSKSPQPVLM